MSPEASSYSSSSSPPLLLLRSNSSPTHAVEALPVGSDVSVCRRAPWLLSLGRARAHVSRPPPLLQHLLPSASIQDAQQWLHRNRFSQFCRLFASFSGERL